MAPDDPRTRLRDNSLIAKKYRLIRELGSGGMGSVYEAENTWTSRHVAVKVMRSDVASNEEHSRRFMQEAQAAGRLAHPNIVDVLDMGRDEATGALYIVQEYLTGCDLRQLLTARKSLTPAEALTILVPVMEALVAAHAGGIVHRDLKPENIFLAVTPRGVVSKLIDFGISKILDTNNQGLHRTGTGVLIGTPYYMSPEQGQGDSQLDGRSDVWSLGVVLYEVLSGVRPFDGPNHNVIVVRIVTADPEPLETVAPAVPADLAAVVRVALEKDVARRYPSMQAFLAAVVGTSVWADASARPDIAPLVAGVAQSVGTAATADLRLLAPGESHLEGAAPWSAPGVEAAPRARTVPTQTAWTGASGARSRRTGRLAAGVLLAAALAGGVAVVMARGPATPLPRRRVPAPFTEAAPIVPPTAQPPAVVPTPVAVTPPEPVEPDAGPAQARATAPRVRRTQPARPVVTAHPAPAVTAPSPPAPGTALPFRAWSD